MYIGNLEVDVFPFFKQFGYVILDEIHEYCSKTRKQIYTRAQSTFMLGLSATPDERDDGLDQVNIWNCGDILDACKLDGYTMDDIPFKGAVTMVKYKGPLEHTKTIINEKLELLSVPKMITQFCEDPYRMQLIINLVIELRKKRKNVFIFADRRNFLQAIGDELHKYKITNKTITDSDDINYKRLVGGATSSEIKYAENISDVILTTYQFMGTGKSIPKMDSIILTTPRKKKSKQYIGRIFRLGSNYDSVREIIDIVDWNTPLKSQWYTRKKYYTEKEYPITVREVSYTELTKIKQEKKCLPLKQSIDCLKDIVESIK